LSAILFLLANALFIGCGLAGLKAAHRRLKTRRVLLVILISIALTWLGSMLLDRMSAPSAPDQQREMPTPP
jgi:hypothetical protein